VGRARRRETGGADRRCVRCALCFLSFRCALCLLTLEKWSGWGWWGGEIVMPRGRVGFKMAWENRGTWGSCWGGVGGGGEDDTHTVWTYRATIDCSWSNSFLSLFPCLSHTCSFSEVKKWHYFENWLGFKKFPTFFSRVGLSLSCIYSLRVLALTLGTFWCLWCRGFQPATILTKNHYTQTAFKK